MSLACHAELPDPDVGRREISEAVLELGPIIAKQAHAHAEAVWRFLKRRRIRDYAQKNEARQLLISILAGRGGGDLYAADLPFP
ncbi:hypothetical protein [Streptomyces sp. NPDC059928]|uniref:hypothetical protein n=1 Tax=unclassified Streptomyces TaxID=2593676 RepID=UPI003646071E